MNPVGAQNHGGHMNKSGPFIINTVWFVIILHFLWCAAADELALNNIYSNLSARGLKRGCVLFYFLDFLCKWSIYQACLSEVIVFPRTYEFLR